MVEITPEIQAQLDEQKKQCPFCKILSGEIPAQKIYNDDLMAGILDINPWKKGHMLLLPKEHYPIMPFLPPQTFKHMFGMMPKLIAAVKKAMLCTGANVFIANGGVAGQQGPHFLVHIVPREQGDKIYNFGFDDKKSLDEEKAKQVNTMLAKNLPLMMQNHFNRNPAKWHNGDIKSASFLSDIKNNQMMIYEDEKTLCVVPDKPQCIGHLVIYSNEEEKLFDNFDQESASHMFFVASFCATAVFEGLGAHGSNIILKTGVSEDNPEGKLCIHVLPRYSEDGIDILPPPMAEKPNAEEVGAKIKDEMFMVEHELKEEGKPKEQEVIDLDANKKVIYSDKNEDNQKEKQKFDKPEDEINHAINKIKG